MHRLVMTRDKIQADEFKTKLQNTRENKENRNMQTEVDKFRKRN